MTQQEMDELMRVWGREQRDKSIAVACLHAARLDPGIAAAVHLRDLARWPDLRADCLRLRKVHQARDRAESRRMMGCLCRSGIAGRWDAQRMCAESAHRRRQWCRARVEQIRRDILSGDTTG